MSLFHLIELEDFHELHDSEVYNESLEYLLFFDYEMAAETLEEGNVNFLEMERNIAHKFSVGMILTGDFRTQQMMNVSSLVGDKLVIDVA